MIEFDKTINQAEVSNQYLNLTDNEGRTYGNRFPTHRAPLWIITEGRRYKASKRGNNQVWGALYSWYIHEDVRAGNTIRVRYDPTSEMIEGRTPIEVSIINREGQIVQTAVEGPEEGEDIEEDIAIISIQMERDLENYIVENLNLIENGLGLYIDERGRNGRQYPTGIGDIDLLCKNNNDLVIIELKKGRKSDEVVGQISRYMGWVKENLAVNQNVRGIIVVHDFDPRLKYAVLAHSNLELKYYEIQIRFITEQQVIDRTEE